MAWTGLEHRVDQWETPREVILAGVTKLLRSSGWASYTPFLSRPAILGSMAQLTFPSLSRERGKHANGFELATAGYVLA